MTDTIGPVPARRCRGLVLQHPVHLVNARPSRGRVRRDRARPRPRLRAPCATVYGGTDEAAALCEAYSERTVRSDTPTDGRQPLTATDE